MKYLNNDRVNKKEFLTLVLELAHISQIREQGDIYKKVKIKRRDIEDLEVLRRGIKKFKKLFKKNINYNFMFYGNKINGEADIIYEDTILDIKTVSSAYLNKEMINQLIMYYLLSGKSFYKIKYVGILFSRYGKYKKFKIRKILSEKDEVKLRKALEVDCC